MQNHTPRLDDLLLSRREMLSRCGMGLGGLALGSLAGPAGGSSVPGMNPLAPGTPHFPGKAKRVIHIFLNGGPSQVDTFDPKPTLDRYHGKALPVPSLKTERPTGAALRSPFAFRQYGESGIPVSELFAKTAQHVDEMLVIRSMTADVPNHEPSLKLMNCGHSTLVRPSVGAWVNYGLGTENQNLPGYVSLCPNGFPIQETANWRSAFLPGSYQGTYVDPSEQDPEKLIAHIVPKHLSKDVQEEQLGLLRTLNRRHSSARAGDRQLEARIHSFELAYRMQMEATDAFDVRNEPTHIREMYGDTMHGRQFLIARRLAERGVRFIQLWHGKGQPWDAHDELEKNHRKLAGEIDQPIAALLTDLKQRGLLEDTLVIWGGEFGRTPVVEMPKPGSNEGKMNGRDHNHHGFTMWMAGGGVKPGAVYGATDEFGFRAVEDKVHVHDLHATLLHLLGFDHERLTYRYAGRDHRLTDVHGRVIRDWLA